MEFGRVDSLQGIDWTLPTLETPLAAAPADSFDAFVGGPGWSYRNFVGKIYPQGTKSAEFLPRYAEQFSTVELNSTYYGVRPGAVAKWAAAAPEGFRFCPKFWSRITHDKVLHNVEADTEQFLGEVREFGAKLGITWLLLPQSFGPGDLPRLETFLHRFAAQVALGVELRHAGFFRDPAAGRAAFDLLAAHRTTALLTDVAGRRDVLHMRICSDTAVVRFVGNGLHASDFVRLDNWVERFAEWQAAGLRQLYVFLHQPDEALTVELAEHLIPRLNARCGTALVPPSRCRAHVQGELF